MIRLRIPHSALRRGFTFVELLVAATMLSILFLGLGAHLRGGLAVWQRATLTVETIRRRQVALDRLERDLANAVVYDERDASYGVEEGTLPRPRFDDAGAAWFTVSRRTARQLPDVRFVTYACADIEGVPGFWRTSQSVGEARVRREPAAERLLPECEQLSFRYAVVPPPGPSSTAPGAFEWQAQWPGSERALPHLVELSVRFRSGDEITRLFAIPIGAFQSS